MVPSENNPIKDSDFRDCTPTTYPDSNMYRKKYSYDSQFTNEQALALISRGENLLGLSVRRGVEPKISYIFQTKLGIVIQLGEKNELTIYWDGHAPTQIKEVTDFLSQRLPGLEQLLPQH